MKCEEVELILSARLDGEATASQWKIAEAHLATCARCAQTWQSFQSSTSLLKQSLPRPEPSPVLWHRLSARLEKLPSEHWPGRLLNWLSAKWEYLAIRSPRQVRFAQAGLAFAMLALIFASLLQITKPQMAVEHKGGLSDSAASAIVATRSKAERPQDASQRQLLARQVKGYFEEATLVLLEVKNSEADPTVMDFTGIRQASQKLLEETMLLKADLQRENLTALRATVEQLEIILLDMANLHDHPASEDIEMLRATIRQNDLLIKIEIIDLKALEQRSRGERDLPPARSRAGKDVI